MFRTLDPRDWSVVKTGVDHSQGLTMPKRRLALKMPAFELPVILETSDGKANFFIFYRQTHNRPEIVHAPDASKIMDNNRTHRDLLIIRTIPSDYFLTVFY